MRLLRGYFGLLWSYYGVIIHLIRGQIKQTNIEKERTKKLLETRKAIEVDAQVVINKWAAAQSN